MLVLNPSGNTEMQNNLISNQLPAKVRQVTSSTRERPQYRHEKSLLLRKKIIDKIT